MEDTSATLGASKKKMPLWIWFVICYSLPLIGGLSSRYDVAANEAQIFGSSVVEVMLSDIFTLVGIIDTFIFPALGSAITITIAIYFYRLTVVKLQRNSYKPLLILLFVASTIFVWIGLSIGLGLLLG